MKTMTMMTTTTTATTTITATTATMTMSVVPDVVSPPIHNIYNQSNPRSEWISELRNMVSFNCWSQKLNNSHFRCFRSWQNKTTPNQIILDNIGRAYHCNIIHVFFERSSTVCHQLAVLERSIYSIDKSRSVLSIVIAKQTFLDSTLRGVVYRTVQDGDNS